MWRSITAVVLALLLVAGPAVAVPAASTVRVAAPQEEEDTHGPAGLSIILAAGLNGRRPGGRHDARPRSSATPAHRRHAVPVRPVAAPVSFRSVTSSPLHC
jgi:hypothetical protein